MFGVESNAAAAFLSAANPCTVASLVGFHGGLGFFEPNPRGVILSTIAGSFFSCSYASAFQKGLPR